MRPIVKSNNTSYYEWCMIDNKGYLEFGNEQGNYQGGTTLSRKYYNHMNRYPEDHIPAKEYYDEVDQWLNNLKERYPDFYNDILEMCSNNFLDPTMKKFMSSRIRGRRNE